MLPYLVLTASGCVEFGNEPKRFRLAGDSLPGTVSAALLDARFAANNAANKSKFLVGHQPLSGSRIRLIRQFDSGDG